MKQQLAQLLQKALARLQQQGVLPGDIDTSPHVGACKDPSHGDYASNCALILCKKARKSAYELAESIIAELPSSNIVTKTTIAKPGFINFSLTEECLQAIIRQAITAGEKFGCSDIGQGKRVHIEYVSANPTGPLHVGHGRGAAFGASSANLLSACGYQVHREYYVNDAGRQMQILALSVWLRYLQLHHENIELPASAYQGSYVMDIAKKLVEQHHSRFHHTQATLQSHQTEHTDDPEKQLDLLVDAAKSILGVESFEIIFQLALNETLNDIRDDLHQFGVDYEQWFYESRLFADGLAAASLQVLEKHGYVFTQDGAKWFKATAFGDSKDRVLVRSNGVSTYFASDVAYHLYKYQQGYDSIIDVFGADHHGYIARIQGFLTALGEDPEKVKTLMVQFAILYRGDKKISMSTRGGQFVTLRELRSEVGNDAARFFYVMRKPEQHLDFDLELAKSHANENPVYYIQYAHARICSVWRQLEAKQQSWDKQNGLICLSLLITHNEKALITALNNYPDIVQQAGLNHEPHSLAHFLLDLANTFHAYYNAEKFIVEQRMLRNARLCLIAAVQQTLVNGLQLLGVSAPTTM